MKILITYKDNNIKQELFLCCELKQIQGMKIINSNYYFKNINFFAAEKLPAQSLHIYIPEVYLD